MKRCGMWFFIGFVLAILFTLCPHPERRTGVFLVPPIGRARAVDFSRLLVPAVEPAETSLHLEARRSRAGLDECLALLLTSPSTMRRCAQTIAVCLGSIPEGPQCWF